MITRIEIDGFKSFADFSIDLPPFLAVIGTNASGKSNLVEALAFVSTAWRRGLDDAVAAIRGDALGMFRQRGDGSRSDHMRFAVEMLLENHPPSPHSGNRWRYELELAWGGTKGRLEGLLLRRQRLVTVAEESDAWLRRVSPNEDWRRTHIAYPQSAETVSVEPSDPAAGRAISLFDLMPREAAELCFLVDRELSPVRLLQLESASLRVSSEFGGPESMDMHGRHLPNFLRKISRRTQTDNRPAGALADVETHLVGLVREVGGIEVIEDERRRDVRIEFSSPYLGKVGAEFASDGTLRMLAMLAALHDPDGVFLAIEEPENGVFPERLRHLLGLMQDLVTDPQSVPEFGSSIGSFGEVRINGRLFDPMRQVLVTSHSPVVLDAVPPTRIAFLDTTTILEAGVATHITRARWLRDAGGPARVEGERWARVTDSELSRFRAGVEASV